MALQAPNQPKKQVTPSRPTKKTSPQLSLDFFLCPRGLVGLQLLLRPAGRERKPLGGRCVGASSSVKFKFRRGTVKLSRVLAELYRFKYDEPMHAPPRCEKLILGFDFRNTSPCMEGPRVARRPSLAFQMANNSTGRWGLVISLGLELRSNSRNAPPPHRKKIYPLNVLDLGICCRRVVKRRATQPMSPLGALLS